MRIFTCNNCTRIHIEAGNILFHFANKEKLAKYLNELDVIDAEYYTALNADKAFCKDIFLPVADTNINLGFSLNEFKEFRERIRNYLNLKNHMPITFIRANKMDICLN
ncbi:MAG: hypothetical protein LBL90_06475 [Prevotellaceae bacterium]|jgi:hypothetical protein|nr:hypothetical protein [Prevotellaceae bacterium]